MKDSSDTVLEALDEALCYSIVNRRISMKEAQEVLNRKIVEILIDELLNRVVKETFHEKS